VRVFKKRGDKRLFEVSRKETSGKRVVSYGGDIWKKKRDTTFKKGSRYGVKVTLLVGAFME
jgi:hypothetical protein